MSATKRATAAATPVSPPPAKKRLRNDFEGYSLNINLAVDKDYENKWLEEMADAPVEAVQGVAERGAEALASLGIKSIRDFGCSKFYKRARAINILAEKEEDEKRADDALANIDLAVVKEYEKKSLKEIAQAPVSALQGISEKVAEGLESIHVRSVADLANNKFAAWCEAISTLASAEVRVVENSQLKRLA